MSSHSRLRQWGARVNRQQQEIVDYLRTENQVVKEAHGKKRIRLNDNQRRRLAVKGKSSAERSSARSAPPSHPTPSCAGIGNW
jgi:hypothetical protein